MQGGLSLVLQRHSGAEPDQCVCQEAFAERLATDTILFGFRAKLRDHAAVCD